MADTRFEPKSIITALMMACYGKMSEMPKKKKKRFSAVQTVKAMARERIGTPPGSRVVPDRKKAKSEKHKLTLGKLLEEGRDD
jgi:hypothetical protein